MSSIIISGDTSGSITVAAPAVSGTNTATLPAATGTVMVSGNMPAFSAYRTGTQSGLASATSTKIQVQTEVFDTNSNYDNATNYRFTPTIAGYYQINAAVVATGTGLAYTQAIIFKNGSAYAQGGYVTTAAGEAGSSAASLVYMNGSTDYLELYAYVSVTAGTGTVYGGSIPQAQTFFNGSMVRAA